MTKYVIYTNYYKNKEVYMAKKGTKKKTGKRRTVETHFAKACVARVGILLNEEEIVNQLQNNKLEFLERQSNNITKWKYIYNEKEYMLVYNKQYKQLVTIIPYKEGMEKNPRSDMYWWIK